MEFDCPRCPYVGDPVEVSKARIIGCWTVRCPECGLRRLSRTDYGLDDNADTELGGGV